MASRLCLSRSGFAVSGHGERPRREFSAARQVFEEVDDALGFKLSRLLKVLRRSFTNREYSAGYLDGLDCRRAFA